MHRATPFVASAALVGAIAGCAGANNSGSTSVACRPLTVTSAQRSSDWSGTVFTIVMENHNRDQILGNSDAPYINSLAQGNAVAAGYHDSYVHPSEPNYIWMVAGENFGILNDNDPGPANTLPAQAHLADQLEHAGLTWKSYQESMGASCGLSSHGTYAAKHNPFVYFDDLNGWNGSSFQPTSRCADHVVDYSQLETDLTTGAPTYTFITPDLNHDMHDGSVADGDAWLSREVPKILASDAFQRGGVLFLLWDEGSNSGDNPPFIAVSPNAKHGFVSRTAYDTSSFLLTVQTLLGLDALPCAAPGTSAQAMSDLFTVPLSSTSAADGGT